MKKFELENAIAKMMKPHEKAIIGALDYITTQDIPILNNAKVDGNAFIFNNAQIWEEK